MLKLVGTEGHDIVDEKVILDDDNRITPFGKKLIVIDILLDLSLFYLFNKIAKKFRKKS